MRDYYRVTKSMCGQLYTFSFYIYFHYCKNNISSCFCFFKKIKTSIKKRTRKIKTPHGNSEFFPWLRVLLVAQAVKNLLAMQETWVQSLDWKVPWRRKWLSIPVFLPGKFHGQSSLAGYNPWGHKESDTAERLTLSLLMVTHIYSWIYIITIVKEFLPENLLVYVHIHIF